jgi:hypothetical protein
MFSLKRVAYHFVFISGVHIILNLNYYLSKKNNDGVEGVVYSSAIVELI